MNNQAPTYGGCGHGDSHACRHNCGTVPAREPHAAMNANPVNRHCMGQCNPPQLYSDTYSYLNGNLMQPVVQEVYNDLKSINPDNTIVNNPMANMGTSKSPLNDNYNNYKTTSENFVGNGLSSNVNNKTYANQKMGSMSGMGPQIVNMMMGDGSSKPRNIVGQNEQLSGSQPQSSSGKVDVTHLKHGNFNGPQFSGSMAMNTGQGSANAQHYMHSDNNAVNNIAQTQPMSRGAVQTNVIGSQQMNRSNSNAMTQEMVAAHSHPHSQHAEGITKFNQMFPGVMQGLGGDLGFDPMSIAIQMNPANQQKVAIDTMQKIMGGKSLNNPTETMEYSGTMQPIAPGAYTGQPGTNQTIPNMTTLVQTAVPGQALASEQHVNNSVLSNLSYNAQQPQPGYTITGNHNNKDQRQPIQYQHTLRQMVDPNTGDVIYPTNLPTVYEGYLEPYHMNSEQTSPQLAKKQQIQEPIFPADTSKNIPTSPMRQEKYYEYNTLGQPVEMLPANMYHTPEPKLPQTLAPQPANNNYMKYSNVKSTVSKTSLLQKGSLGKTPSRGQLHNQYKGSQSYTHQNIKGSGYGITQSEGNLKVNPGNSVNQAPIEIVGDTIAENLNAKHKIPAKVGQTFNHNGDTPVSKPTEDAQQKVRLLKLYLL